MNFEEFWKFDDFWKYADPIIKAIIILAVGILLVKLLVKILNRSFIKAKLDKSLSNFLIKSIRIISYIILIATVLAILGIPTTGILAAFSAIAVGVGVALKDSLGNVAGGILLLFFPRFTTGDHIEVDDDEGKVIAVDLMHTTILTFDNKQISIPNGVLINNHITNYSREDKRRVDILFPISYECDVEKAKAVALKTIKSHNLTLNEPEKPFVRVKSYGESSVNLITRVWCKTDDYWKLQYDLTEQIRAEFDKNNIGIPYNQLDVFIKNK